MSRTVPVIVGIILVLFGIGWASQGAGIIGGSSLMDNNPAFIYLGTILTAVGIVLLAYGAFSRPKTPSPPRM